MLKIRELSKVYAMNGRKICAVKSFSMSAELGEVVCLLGPNGAGKTTIIKMLCGLVKPTTGHVSINNLNLSNRHEYLNQIAVVLEGTRNIYWRLTPYENIELACRMRGYRKRNFKDKIDYYISLLELEKYLNIECRLLSRGNQQKVAVACALSLNAKVLLLDEPTLGLDVEVARRMMDVIAHESRNSRLVIVTTHDMEFIENTASRIVLFKDGAIKKISTPEEVVRDYGNGNGRLSEAYLKLMWSLNGLS